QTTVLKRSETDYNLAPAYASRRIIGLPLESRAFGRENGVLLLASKMTYLHDAGNFNDGTLNQNISPVQHDTANFGASFIDGRGNMTSMTRHDVTGQTAAVTQSVKYNTAGAPVARISPWDGTQVRTTKIDYTDNFNTTANPTTFAYPTKLYDPAGNFSQVKYRYDIGANVWATSPAPAGNSTGKTTERTFDSIGRLQKDLIINTGAYTRYEYPTNGIQSKVFSTIVDTNGNNTGDAADEVLSESWSDGAGRVLRSRSPHTFDATGNPMNWAGSIVEYDIFGRTKRQSVPTEISVSNPSDPNSWTPAGDDLTRGWLWTHQKYDWLGRVIRKINTDGVDSPTLNDSDILISYDGCGCAGGLVTTVQGELAPRDDEPTQSARRIEKTYTDILGRVHKTESLKWDSVSVYTSSTSLFNGLDQPTTVRQFKGAAVLNNEHQTSTMTYDGHGRLKTSHQPEQRDSNNDPTYTTYNYNADDSIASVTDGRGAVTNDTYNSRGLLEQVSYAVPSGSTIPMISPTSFVYDAVGNRSQMTDQTGTTNYAYDSLSRITSETKQFNGQNSSPTNAFTIAYQYHLGGELKSITNPFTQRVDYATDKLGRLTQVTGIPFRNTIDRPQPPYILGNIQYYAFGAVKSISYGSGAIMSQSFNNRMQVSEYKVRAVPFWATTEPWNNMHAINMEYSYLADGRIRYSKYIPFNNIDSTADRGYKYDQVGRITNATTGAEARGGIEPNDDYRPYRQNFVYDVWGNVTTRDSRHYSYQENTQHLYSNNRESSWSYDNDGRLTRSNRLFLNYNERIDYVFDAAGSLVTSVSDTAPQCEDTGTTRTTSFWTDGDGKTAARRITAVRRANGQTVEDEKKFRIHSSVLDQVISEVYTDGSESMNYTYAFDEVVARQQFGFVAGMDHRDPSNSNFSTTRTDQYGGTESGGTMLDPSGSNVGGSNPLQCESNLFDDWWSYQFGPSRRSGSCSWDGAEVNCGLLMRLLMGDSVTAAPSNQSVQVTYNGKKTWAHFKAYGDGYSGYAPSNASYLGNGRLTPAGQGKPGFRKPGTPRDTNIGQLNGANIKEEQDLRFDDDAELEALLRQMAGPRAGPDGGPTDEEFIRWLMNLNCIANVLPNGRPTNRPGYDPGRGHDGMHVYSQSNGQNVNVTALPAMAGIVRNVRSQGDGLYRMDIQLKQSVNGEPYYLILKDLTSVGSSIGGGRVGPRNVQVKAGQLLGRTRGEISPPSIDFKGLHVTMVSAKNYRQLSQNIRSGMGSPTEWLMNAATNLASPFRCF
ncbi:MAG: RHS repeat domain-containing protein, partial [Pyrinomonadaceae bacterium]